MIHCFRTEKLKDDTICHVCGKVEKSKKLLRRHMVKHSDVRNHLCPYCPKKFKRRYEVTAHIKVMHDESSKQNRPYECQLCDSKFAIPSKLELHMKRHRKEFKCECHVCGKGFYSEFKRQEHLSVHTGVKKFQCETCGRSYSYKADLTSHRVKHHPETCGDMHIYTCSLCKKTFPSLYTFTKHNNIHSGTNLFQCSECNKNFNTNKLLKSHMVHHSNERPYACDCGKTFKRSFERNIHRKSHDLTKSLICELCGYTAVRKATLEMHIKRHRKEFTVTCDVCQKGFYSEFKLREHSNKHTGTNHVCSVCPKSYPYRGNLVAHMKTAHGTDSSSKTRQPFDLT